MKRLNRCISWVVRLLWYLLVALLAVTLIHVAAAKHRGQVPEIAGYSLFRIATGSMEPAIPAGTYILVRQTPAEQLQVGDIITYISRDPMIRGLPNTHRIAEIRREPELSFVTRGDNNLKDDELPVDPEQLIGRHVKNMDGLTKFAEFFMQESVLAAMLLLQAVSAVLMHLYTRKLKKQAAIEQQQADEALEEKKRALIDAEIARLRALDQQSGDGPEDEEKEETR